MSDPDPQSPCISVCMLDDDDNKMGCYRSADDITDWFLADAEGKRAIIRRARERRDAASAIKLG